MSQRQPARASNGGVIARALRIPRLALLITACATPAAQVSQSPDGGVPASVPASAEPTPSPARTQSASPAPSHAPIEASPTAATPSGRANIAEVVTTDLVMRSAPGTGPDSEIYTPSLSSPMLLYILEGPVAADGHDWFYAVRFEEFYSDIGLAGPGVGWVADAGKDGESWVEPWAGVCPPATAEELMWRSNLIALACFGDRELTLEGTLGDCFGLPSDAPRSWVDACVLVPFGAPPGRLLGGFGFYVQSAAADGLDGTPVRITGHYDDPAALTCAANDWEGPNEPLPELKVMACRVKFVATDITPTSAP